MTRHILLLLLVIVVMLLPVLPVLPIILPSLPVLPMLPVLPVLPVLPMLPVLPTLPMLPALLLLRLRLCFHRHDLLVLRTAASLALALMYLAAVLFMVPGAVPPMRASPPRPAWVGKIGLE